MTELILDACPDGGAVWLGLSYGDVAWAGRLCATPEDAANALDAVPPTWRDHVDALTLEDVRTMWADLETP